MDTSGARKAKNDESQKHAASHTYCNTHGAGGAAESRITTARRQSELRRVAQEEWYFARECGK